MACEIIWENTGILFKNSGTVDDQEVKMINDLIYGDARFETITYQISDYTEVTNNLITRTDAKVIGTLDRISSRWTSKIMMNVVVTQDKKSVPVVETYFKEFKGTKWEGKIFDTLEMAYDWVKSD